MEDLIDRGLGNTILLGYLGPPGPLVVALYVGQSVTLIDSDTLKHPFGGPSRFSILLIFDLNLVLY